MLEITVAQFEAIPREWRTTRNRTPIPYVDGWISAKLTDDIDELPFAGVYEKANGLYTHAPQPAGDWKPGEWREANVLSVHPQEITIAVWADGKFCPITVSPEAHVKEVHEDRVLPVRYETWTRHEECYSLKSSRAVEMRPVVLP